MKKASFGLESYVLDKVNLDSDNHTSTELSLKFVPSGLFDKKNSRFHLSFEFLVFTDKNEDSNPYLSIRCKGVFKFEEEIEFSQIPNYFYQNSIAILFPYLRAYVSLITNQSNLPPVILPTLNLQSMLTPLKENSKELLDS
jgi:preprotein translocase subunit SecB